jgi:hypothetical protein
MNAGPRAIRIMTSVQFLGGRVIHHHAQRERDRARELRATVKNYAGEKRQAIEHEIKQREEGAKNGRNLYRWVSSGFRPAVRLSPGPRPALTRRASLSGFRTTAPPVCTC